MRKVVGGGGRGFLETGGSERCLLPFPSHLSSLSSSAHLSSAHHDESTTGEKRERERGGADEVGFLQFIISFLVFSSPFFLLLAVLLPWTNFTRDFFATYVRLAQRFFSVLDFFSVLVLVVISPDLACSCAADYFVPPVRACARIYVVKSLILFL
jgi:hypothetical protein